MTGTHGKLYYDNVIVVESPNIAAQLQRLINSMSDANTFVTSTRGHLYDYQIINQKITLAPLSIPKIESMKLLNGQNIVVATDNDPQGELIAQHIKMLTPDSIHKRGYFNDLSESGVIRSINSINMGVNFFNDDIAVQASVLKIMNLMLKQSNDTYITTTALTIAKSLASATAITDLSLISTSNDNKMVNALIPSNDQVQSIQIPHPLTTKDILKKEVLKGNMDTMKDLQDSFEASALSYIRTDSLELPPDSESVLQEFTCKNMGMNNNCFSEKQNLSHYALHNTDHPITHLEQDIAKHNRSALTGDGKINMINMESGASYYTTEHTPQLFKPSPTQCIKLNLINSPDSYSSTIESASKKYTPLFFNGTTQNKGMINKVLNIAGAKCENVLEKGIKIVLEDITRSKDFVQELSKTQAAPNKNLGNPIAELSEKSEVIGEIWDKMKVNRSMF